MAGVELLGVEVDEKVVQKAEEMRKRDSTEDLIHLAQAIREHIGHFVLSACQLSTGQLIQHSQMVTQLFFSACVCVSVSSVCLCLQQRTDETSVTLSISCHGFIGASRLACSV